MLPDSSTSAGIPSAILPNLAAGTDRLDIEGAAHYLGVSVRSVRNYTRDRLLSSFRVGRRLTYSQQELSRFVLSKEQPRAEGSGVSK